MSWNALLRPNRTGRFGEGSTVGGQPIGKLGIGYQNRAGGIDVDMFAIIATTHPLRTAYEELTLAYMDRSDMILLRKSIDEMLEDFPA